MLFVQFKEIVNSLKRLMIYILLSFTLPCLEMLLK